MYLCLACLIDEDDARLTNPSDDEQRADELFALSDPL